MLNKVVKILFRLSVAVFVSFICLMLLLAYSRIGWEELINSLPDIVSELTVSLEYWVFVFSILLILQLFSFLRNSYMNFGFWIFVKKTFLFLPITLFSALFQLSKWYLNNESYIYDWENRAENQMGKTLNRFDLDGKQRGVHVFGELEDIDLETCSKYNSNRLQ